jgi:hypothetical protein
VGDDDLFFALNSHYPLLLKIYLFLDSILSKVQMRVGASLVDDLTMQCKVISKTRPTANDDFIKFPILRSC